MISVKVLEAESPRRFMERKLQRINYLGLGKLGMEMEDHRAHPSSFIIHIHDQGRSFLFLSPSDLRKY